MLKSSILPLNSPNNGGGVSALNFVFLDEKFSDKRQFSNRLKFREVIVPLSLPLRH